VPVAEKWSDNRHAASWTQRRARFPGVPAAYFKTGATTEVAMDWQEYLNNYMREQERAYSWRDFQVRFMALAREEQGRPDGADVITKGETLRRLDQALRASCDYERHPEVWVNRENPEQRHFYLLDTPPHGVWSYANDGISENFLERVRLCVAEAGRALPDYPKGADPEDFWLHRLYLDLLRNNSDLLFCTRKEGGMILSICVASATFCARLERQALAHAENGAKTGIVASLAETENLDQPGAAERFHRQVKTTKLAVALGDSTLLDRLRTDEYQAESSPAPVNGKIAHPVVSKSTGRPRKDGDRELVRELKAKGQSWKDIAATVNAKTGQNKSADAYRSLFKNRSGAEKKGQK